MKRDIALYLQDIAEASDKIATYIRNLNFEKFASNQLVIDAVIRNLEVIGEAAKHIPAQIKATYPQIPWRNMAGMRDVLIHAYFGVDLQIVWHVITKDLPPVAKQIKILLKQIEQQS